MLVDATAQKTYKNSLTCTVLALEAKPPGTGGRPSLSTPWSGTGGQCQPLAVSPTHPNNVPCPPTQNWNASAVHRRRSVAHLESAIKETIARGARRQVRLVLTPLRRELLRLRKKVTELQATVTSLRRNAEGWKRLMQTVPAIPHVSAEDAKAARLSPRLIRTLRKRLGLSQVALARLVGVSAPAVAHWEAGNSAPKEQNRAHLVALRKMGKREVKELLARRVKERASRSPSTRRRHAKRSRKNLRK